jgi:hypothetical protein
MMTEVKEFKFEETKLFEATCEVLNIDTPHPLLRLNELAVAGDPIVVTGYDGKPIGSVEFSLRMDGWIVADLKLEYSCPERLDIENGNVYLDVGWYLGDEEVHVYDVEVAIGWVEPEHAQLVLVKPFPDTRPVKVK